MSTSRESPSVSTRLSAPLGFIPGGWNESFSSPEHEQLSTDPSQSVSSSKQDTSKEQVVSFTPSTRGGRHSFKKSTVPPPSDRTSVAAARGRYGFSHKMKEFFSLHSKPQGKLQPSATSDTNASRQLRFSFRKKVSPENHSDHPSPTVAATHTHDQSQTVRSVSAGAFLANPQLRQAPHAGRRTGARYSFRASSRPIELSFEDGRTSPLGSAHGSHTTHDDGLSPEIKSYAPGDQQSSVVSHSTSPHPETVSALLTTEHRVSISPMSPIMGTSHKPWRSKRQAGTVQRTIPDPQQSSPSADPSPALRPPEIPHRHSPPYSGADQVENHVHAPRRLRFNFGERRHGDSELSAATNASVGGSGSQERSVAVPSDYDQPSITSRNHRRLRFNFGERHHGDSELSAVTDAGMGGSGSQERPVAGPSNYDQSSGVDHRRAEKWLRRIMGEPRPRPAAPTKRPKRRHHTAAPLAQTAVIQFAQPESDNAEDSSPYQAQLDLVCRQFAYRDPNESATVGDIQAVVGLAPRFAVEERPMKRRKIDPTMRIEVYDSRGPGIRINEKRRDPDLLELQEYMRSSIGELMNRKAASPIPLQAVATEKDIEDFNNGISDGPTQQLFKLQLPGRITPWNDRATEVALAYMEERSELKLPRAKDMEQIIKSHIGYLSECYKKQLRRQDPKVSNLADEDKQRVAARDSRRRNLHHRRKETVAEEPELERYRALWKSLPYTVNSGDETDVRGGVQRRVRTRPRWRSPEFSEHCHRIDSLYLFKRIRDSGFMHTGAGGFPTFRLVGGSRIQQYKGLPPLGLPLNCYDRGWLAEQPRDARPQFAAVPAFDFSPSAYEVAVEETFANTTSRDEVQALVKTCHQSIQQRMAETH